MLFSNTKNGDLELKELQDAIYSLFNSGQGSSQKIALMQCENVGLNKFDLIWSWIKKNWKKKKIIKDWGLAYADGELERNGEYCIFKCDLIGGEFSIIDLGDKVYVWLPNRSSGIVLANWGDKDVGSMYNAIFRNIKLGLKRNIHLIK